jgi:diguanylate cyclase (GGDEF)-like protein
VTAMQIWPSYAPSMLNGIALLLALGFRRNRAAMVLAIVTCASLLLAGGATVAPGERSIEAVRMFAPWLLLAAAAMPERRLAARRNLLLLGLLALAGWSALAASGEAWAGLRDLLALGWLPWSSGQVAAGLVVIAAACCLVRWMRQRTLMEFALVPVLVVVAIALLPVMRPGATNDLLGVAGAIALMGVLYTSYRMAFVDGLAGLPNRRALDETLARISGDYALAMVDVDHFKAFNDRHGHAAGDRALRAVAGQLRVTRGASAFRYGGEEFCLLFSGARAREAKQTCEELRERIAQMHVSVRSPPAGKKPQAPRRRNPGAVKVTVSIGLAGRGAQTRPATDVLKAADKALYRAKTKGRNRVVSG